MGKILINLFFLVSSVNCMDKNIKKSDTQKTISYLSDSFKYNISNFKIYVSRLKGNPAANIKLEFVIPGVESRTVIKNVKSWDLPEANRKIKNLGALSVNDMKRCAKIKKDLILRELNLSQSFAQLGTLDALIFEAERKFRDTLFSLAEDSVEELIRNQDRLNINLFKDKLKKWFLCYKCRKKDDKNEVVEYEADEDITLTFADELEL